MKVTIKIKGVDSVLKEINRRLTEVDSVALPGAIQDIAFDLLGRSKERAPIDTGDLRGSGYAKINKKTARVGFNTPYALVQHERLDYNHPNGGEAKYLENPLKEQKNNYLNRIKKAVKGAVT